MYIKQVLNIPLFLTFAHIQAVLPGLPIFSLSRGHLHPFLDFLGGIFTPCSLRGYHCLFKGAKLSQDLSVTKSYFECSIWILSVMHTASYKKKKKSSNVDVDAGLLSTAWT